MSTIIAAIRVLLDIARDQRTGSDVERELNNQFDGWQQELTTYSGETVVLELESITARPKYKPETVSGGIQRVEPWFGFSDLEEKRETASLDERIAAIAKDEWVTRVRFNLRQGEIRDIRPEGLNLSYITNLIGLREAGRQLRVAKTSEVQSDKLEMKILYRGSIGEYRQEISDAIDLLRYLQKNMDQQVILYLIELYHSGQFDGDSDSVWPSKEQAAKLGRYLVGGPVDTAALAESIQSIKRDIEDQSAENTSNNQ